MLTLAAIIPIVSLYTGNVIGLGALFVNPLVIVIAGLVTAVVIMIGAVVLFSSSGKKKAANRLSSGMTDWQRQPQQGAPGTMNAWNQQTMPTDNAWAQPGQQQANVWGKQLPAPQTSGWDAQQQQQPAWDTPTP